MSRVRDIANILSGVSTDMATDAELNAHAAAADPHTEYLKESEYNAAGKNKIINGDFNIWQRGTSFTISSNNTYTADRWLTQYLTAAPTWTVSQQSFTPGTAPVAGYEGQYFLRSAVTAVGTATAIRLAQRIEDVRTFAGQTATVSFWAKAASDFTITMTVQQSFGSGGSADVTVDTPSFNITTSWQRFTYTISVSSVSGKTIGTGSYLNLRFNQPTTGATTFDIWGMQLEAGSVATPFQTATGTIQGELAACMRYYQNWGQLWLTAIYIGGGVNGNYSNEMRYPVVMRTSPTLSYTDSQSVSNKITTYTSSAAVNNVTATLSPSATSLTISASGNNGYIIMNPYNTTASAEL